MFKDLLYNDQSESYFIIEEIISYITNIENLIFKIM